MAKKSWAKQNDKVFAKCVKEYSEKLQQRIHQVCYEFALHVFEYISDTTFNEGDGNMPYYSGNMRDSTALGVYFNGSLTAYIPPSSATRAQRYDEEAITDIWGKVWISDVLATTQDYQKGLWVVLYSAVPYAMKIEEKGSKYWEPGWFSEGIVEKQLLPAFKIAFAREFPNIKLTV